MPLSQQPEVACHRALRVRMQGRSLGVFLLLWTGVQHDAARADSSCRNVDSRNLAVLNTLLPEGFAADVDTVRALVRKLHDERDIPLSFIEDEADEPIALPEGKQTLEQVLRAVTDWYERYRCEAVYGRLMLRSANPLFDVVISGVDVVEEYRFPAMRAYIDHLVASDQRFKEWVHPLIALGGIDSDSSPVFDGRVTLSPQAPVILHLVQLLGNEDPYLYFEVPAPGEYPPGRTIWLGAVLRPWERRFRRPPPPKDESPQEP